ncbi:protease [Halalkalibacterium halodurans]|uniref:M50 family metallopeptidase n=1 Tax=Halalkalibacterium halodurans TaxID=86665 RepID=UPI001068414A|nr:M50 family metallopeptidase [Halalkalibacterium halodurans]TES51598.1 protease [Halalkalibacterium halodurans]
MISYLALFKKMKVNPLFWFVIGMGVLTGYFREVLMVFVIVFVHEMGHAVAAHFFRWRIRKIELLPFGGVAEVEEGGNRSFKEEVIIITAGPLQHVWMMAVSYGLVALEMWNVSTYQQFLWYNVTILAFNLLPILPLDGGRLIQLLCMRFWPYRLALRRTVGLSFLFLTVAVCVAVILYPFHLNLWLVLAFLIVNNYLEYKQCHYRFIRFLTERFYIGLSQQGKPHLPVVVSAHQEVSEVAKQFRRGVIHTIIVNDAKQKRTHYLPETEVLRALFEAKLPRAPLSTIIAK